MKGTGSTKL